MGLITTDITPTLECMHGAIDQWETDRDTDRCNEELLQLTSRLPSPFDHRKFVSQVLKLMLACSPARAREFVDILGPRVLTTFGYFAIRTTWLGLKLGAVVALVLAVLWIAGLY